MGTKRELLFGVIMGGLVLVVSSFLSVAIVKNGYLAPDISQLLFPTLIQVNATLIGFWGIVFIFTLKSIDEERRYLHKLKSDAISKIEQMTLMKENLNDREKEVVDRWSTNIKSFHNHTIIAHNASRGFTVYGIIVVSAFVISILLCILSLGRMEEAGVGIFYVFLSLEALLLGVAFSFYGVWWAIPESLEVLEKSMHAYSKKIA